MILLDTSGLWSWIDEGQVNHERVVAAMAATDPPYLLSPFVLAELDYLLATRVGAKQQDALLEEVEAGSFQLEPFAASDVRRAREIMGRFDDHAIGLADASIVVLAERHGASRMLTLDERHFRILPGPGGRPFELLPADV